MNGVFGHVIYCFLLGVPVIKIFFVFLALGSLLSSWPGHEQTEYSQNGQKAETNKYVKREKNKYLV